MVPVIPIETVTRAMESHTRKCAPGSECTHWQDYVQDCVDTYGSTPWELAEEDAIVAQDWAEYWLCPDAWVDD